MVTELTIHGDLRSVVPTLDIGSFDAIVCDPPYELGFMGKSWDSSGVAFDAHTWQVLLNRSLPGTHLVAFGHPKTHHHLMYALSTAGWELRDVLCWVYGNGMPKGRDHDGRSTTLRPSWEPLILARKALEGSALANDAQYGTGLLNIDATRIDNSDELSTAREPGERGAKNTEFRMGAGTRGGSVKGRWPSNFLHDGTEEVMTLFPEAKGQVGTVGPEQGMRVSKNAFGDLGVSSLRLPRIETERSAARFFYCARASSKERGEYNNHPTVKPLALMRWIVRLVTPDGGTVLDPFCGSGSTLVAAQQEGYGYIGIDTNAEYVDITRRRLGEEAEKAA